MRFSHFLKYNAVPEWQNQYLDYVELKNLIYTLQADEIKQNGGILGDEFNNATNNINGAAIDVDEDGNPIGSSSRADNLKNRIRNTFFRSSKKNKNNKNDNTNTNDDDIADKDDQSKVEKGQITEETYELETFDNTSNINNNNKGTSNSKYTPENTDSGGKKLTNPFNKKLKVNIFDRKRHSSTSSASSSDERTLFSPYDSFVNKLQDERTKIDDFYQRQEAKFYERFNSLKKDLDQEGVTTFNETFNPVESPQRAHIPSRSQSGTVPTDTINQVLSHKTNSFDLHKSSEFYLRSRFDQNDEEIYDEDELEDDDFNELDDTQENSALLNYSHVNIKSQKLSILKHSIVNLYIDLCQLKSFIDLNRIGFGKITKKFDKVLHMNTRQDLILSGEFFKSTYVFQHDTLNVLNEKIHSLIEFYSFITHRPNEIDTCKAELKSSLHDHIVWERSITWKDMLGLVSQDKNIMTDMEEDETTEKHESKLEIDFFYWNLPREIHWRSINIARLGVPKLFFTLKAAKLAFIITFTGILLGVKTFNDHVEGRCMALVECVAFLWASEAIPLHVTAFLVPLLTVLFKVLKTTDGKVMGAADASSEILSTMWSSTIMILLAGFTLGEVLSQYNIAKILASWLLAFAGTKPRNVLLMAMGVVFFLSMWISNVASPVLTYSLLAPLLDPLDADTPFAKALVMGVALSADIGGMASPISSPQNIISMDYLKPYGIGWGQFFAVALPCGILAMLCSWGLMCLTFKINTTKLEKFTPIRTKLTLKQYYIVFVTLGTILLWCVEGQVEGAFGSSGQIAVLPIVLFFGTGLLSTNDLNTFPWSIVILAMGGIALGKAVSSSGLLVTIATALQRKIQNDGLFAILCIFGILMLVVGTFVSHTVSAIIIVPLVQQVGNSLADPKAAPTLVFGCSLLASCGMGLASSGFPNVTAISLTDKKGNRYLDVLTFLSRGVPASLFAFLCVITVGYGIMISVLHGSTTAITATSS
ncbi:similar to Saccharomyces cerevisiae YCR037C PHO87 Low-affinity inorganic phosphate (Pi) transporter, involved in activation of PHO pathway [Maudiozyma barnettii]|uniref:Similar to Saccharomyces cerevisiae YCR037C PHO87 Low-affinity inorganic phosphate (Pi) transporter, involved in activation of PHO pathway n=1 Tax=Maudiozyma barnettii TaxID=61262 RepID=A0A8H2VDJ4_9SACH|nr:SPX domain-containing inorganic phosphate transporter [Kazachstania barnettii]CAB4253298.1 similar to Saccharomyces cerevisiae YCR037C PHO87 Low-affinity inorganic phosphate (Pi) transporter, involved in activation of PHO pathway [Kazachstania barnettii]CAD1780166.1 similar to Saccharomyces cerevisiae YCR037C PHO87 Low-affinity inorganic phosphate (Pi) transporter, involved in activation of PHO pathway [Kazachstania barnettii]